MKKHALKYGAWLALLVGLVFLVVPPIHFTDSTVVEAATYQINKKKLELKVSQQSTLKISGKKQIKWYSTNKKVVKVDSKGKVTALKKGSAQVYTKIGNKKYTCTIKVTDLLPSKITVKSTHQRFLVGKKATLKVSVAPKKAVLKNVKFSSSDSKIASVNQQGVITGLRAGKVTISARTTNGKTAKTTIEIIPKPEVAVLGNRVSLGETKAQIVQKFGEPTRRGKSNYGEETLVYADDADNLSLMYLAKGKLVALYTNASTFDYQGITPKSSGQTFSSDEYEKYYWGLYHYLLQIDKTGTGLICGLFIQEDGITRNAYTKEVLANMEQEVFDLTNSYRVKNELLPLSWSDMAASSAKKHSVDMAKNDYFSHTSLSGKSPFDRMTAEGIVYHAAAENIIAGYPTSFSQSHGWFQSSGHRKNMLNPDYEYLGMGTAYQSGSTYGVYSTQNFYRERDFSF